MAERICSVDGCERTDNIKRGWCGMHYLRWRNHGDPGPAGRLRQKLPDSCSIDGCDDDPLARGWCSKHYQRWERHGDPNADVHWQIIDETLLERFFRLVRQGHAWECWEWQGTRLPFGYGTMCSGERNRKIRVHRFAYEQFEGPIPDGLEIDHLCNNPPCCNPAHLEPVTHAENMRRASARGWWKRSDRP